MEIVFIRRVSLLGFTPTFAFICVHERLSYTFDMARRAPLAAALIVIVILIALWMRDRSPQLYRPDILSRVQQLNRLTTVRYTIQKVVGLTDQKYPVGSESILLIMQANVDAERAATMTMRAVLIGVFYARARGITTRPTDLGQRHARRKPVDR